jgi:exopolysaccharide production protein ExoQ
MTTEPCTAEPGDLAAPPRSLLRVPLACIWLLTAAGFSAPGRDNSQTVGTLDVLGLAKVALRGVVLVALAGVLLRVGRQPRLRAVMGCLLPFGLYFLWASLSVAWAAMPSLSLGQVGTLLVMLLLAAVLGTVWSGPRDTSVVVCHLSGSLLAVTLTILAVAAVSWEASGLDGRQVTNGTAGLLHPTSSGATAALGLVVLITARLRWGWRWTRVLLVPGVLAHGLLLVLAASRTAEILTLLLVPVVVVAYAPRSFLWALAFAGLAGTAYPVLDPDMDLASRATQQVEDYATRGESAEEMATVTGRIELWAVIWEEYCESPVCGHGYFMCSVDGVVDAWGRPAHRTAHNVMLQVLSSTGLIGIALFLWAWVRVVRRVRRGLRDRPDDSRPGVLLALLGVWFLGWGLFSESFMGPLEPEVIVFFTMLGLGLAALPATPQESPAVAGSEPAGPNGTGPGAVLRRGGEPITSAPHNSRCLAVPRRGGEACA